MNDDSTCITDGCTRPIKIKARGLCGPHYQAAWKAGTLTDAVRMGPAPTEKPCRRSDCGNRHKAFGLCRKHLDEARRNGELPAAICTFDECERVQHSQTIGLCLAHYRQHKKGLALTPIEKRERNTGTCNGPECDRPARSKGYCSGHYYQASNDQPLQPIRQYRERGVPCDVRSCGRPALSEGLCRTHYGRRLAGEANWDRPIPKKAPSGSGHIDKHGYRLIQHEGRQRREHTVIMEELLGRPLPEGASVHHLNGNRADNRTDGPLELVNGKLRSGNLELWSSAQPAGQEIGPKLEWAIEMLAEYGEFAPEEMLGRMAAVLGGRGWPVERQDAGDGERMGS